MFSSISTLATLLVAGTLIVQLAAWLALSRALTGTTFSSHKKANIRIGFGAALLVWFGIIYALATSGFYAEATVLKQVISLLIPFSIGLGLLVGSKSFREVLAALPQTWMIGIHSLRVIGVVFLLLGAQNVLPRGFATLAGYGDIVAGVLAPVAAVLYTRKQSGSRVLAIGWNLFGALDFAVAASGLFAVAAFFKANPAPVVQSSLTTLLVIAVPILLLLHIFSLRGLFAEGRSSTSDTDKRAVAVSAS